MAVGVGKGVAVSVGVAVAKRVAVLVGGTIVCVEITLVAAGDVPQAVKIPTIKQKNDERNLLIFMIYSFFVRQ